MNRVSQPEYGPHATSIRRTYRVDGPGFAPRIRDGEYLITDSSAEHEHGAEIVVLRTSGKAELMFCFDPRSRDDDVVDASVVVVRAKEPYLDGPVLPLVVPMPLSRQVSNDRGELIDLVEPLDRRLALLSPHPTGAWFEDRLAGEPISIVVTPRASDQRLEALAKRFDLAPDVLTAFRDALPT